MKNIRIMAIALTMVAAFAMSAVASDWNFYGSARVSTFVTDIDKAAGPDTTNLAHGLQSNARIGARVIVNDELSGHFEYGANNGNANVRHLYGVWNFGPGSLLVGQTNTPVWLGVSNQVYAADNGLGGWGENYTPRVAQLRLQFGGLQIALVKPDTNYYTAAGLVDTGVEVSIPAIQAKYRLSMDNWFAAVSGAYNSFEIGTTNSQDVDSFMVAGSAGITFGAASLKTSVFAGTNVGNIAKTDVTGDDDGKGYALYDGTNVTDVDSVGYALVASYKINDMFALEAGLGYVENTVDDADLDNDVVSYYVQVPTTLAPGVIIVPEIGSIDYKQTGEDEVLYYGVKWQINF